jgi:hypothetical protein
VMLPILWGASGADVGRPRVYGEVPGLACSFDTTTAAEIHEDWSGPLFTSSDAVELGSGLLGIEDLGSARSACD